MTLEELAKRVEAGEGVNPADPENKVKQVVFGGRQAGKTYTNTLVKALDGSIDAVEKLRKELLPDLNINIRQCNSFYVCEFLTKTENEKVWSTVEHTGTADTEAAARLAALLRALEKEKEEQGEGE